MKKQLFITTLLLAISSTACSKPEIDCAVFPTQQDTQYLLPYKIGTSHTVFASTEHYRKSNHGVGLYAVDFPMPIGTNVLASRAGKVVSIREHFKDGNNIDLEENYIFIKHDDGTIARYFHLTHNGALVEQGDIVKAGDIIGLSGNTGESTGPHLHFDVQKCGPNLPPNYNQLPCGQTVPVTFKNTHKHQCGVKAGIKYSATKL